MTFGAPYPAWQVQPPDVHLPVLGQPAPRWQVQPPEPATNQGA